jgi:6-pyruvoyltetrahydropterin/6-carboxytetrahydropterin synthase
MKLTLYTEDYFDAAHFIKDYDGKCSNLHGHTWKICVWVRGDEMRLDSKGLLWDFGNLKKLIGLFDHKNLNDVLDFNPTVENLVLYSYKKLKQTYAGLEFKIRIYEKIIKKESYCETGDFDV